MLGSRRLEQIGSALLYSPARTAFRKLFTMSVDQFVDTICTALQEKEERPRAQVTAIIETLGVDPALRILAQTDEIERQGGMMLPDGSRRRTPGGVFFFLARQQLSREDRKRIFPPPSLGTMPGPRPKKEAAPKADEPPTTRRRVVVVDVEPRPAQKADFGRRPGYGGSRHDPRPPRREEDPLQRVRRLARLLTEDERRTLLSELAAELGVGAPVSAKAVDRDRLDRDAEDEAPASAPASASVPLSEQSADEVIGNRLLEAIRANPGQRMEDISSSLGVSSKVLGPYVKRLIGAQKVRTVGQKRATRYFPE